MFEVITDHVWFYGMQADGMSLDAKRTPLLPEEKLGPVPGTALGAGGTRKTTCPTLWRNDGNGMAEIESSFPHFISKLAIAEEEADETCYWLELIIATELLPKERPESLLAEAKEITAILTAAGKTAKERREN